MYEKIKHYLQRLFLGKPSQEDVLKQKYKLLAVQISHCNTLAELFTARACLIEYSEEVKKIGSPSWAKNNVKFLEARWNRRYRLWKSRG